MVCDAVSFAVVSELLEPFGSLWKSLARLVRVFAFLIGILKFFCIVSCILLSLSLLEGFAVCVETICKLFGVDFVNWKWFMVFTFRLKLVTRPFNFCVLVLTFWH